jgi:hypothetical protein
VAARRKTNLPPAPFIEGLVSEVVVLDGIDTGILSHIGLLCWVE